jgi:hypothetical protein
MGCCTPKCALNYHIAMAIVGLIAGLISFFVFDFYYENYHAGSWGLLAALISIGNLHLHLLFKHGRLHTFHSERSLTAIVFLGLALVAASGIAMICYGTISYVDKIPMMPAGPSLIMGMTQSFLAFKYAAMLAWFARKYAKTLQREYGLVE